MAQGKSEARRLQAGPIAREYLIKGRTLKAIGEEYGGVPGSTILRNIQQWFRDGALRLVVEHGDTFTIGAEDETLSCELKAKTNLFNAVVYKVSGLEAGFTEDYLSSDGEISEAAHMALDALHVALGEGAARYLERKLNPAMTIGMASGRAVGFLINALRKLDGESTKSRRRPLEGYGRVRLVSLCGGARVVPSTMRVIQSFDADDNVFGLMQLMRLPRANVTYMGGGLAREQNDPATTVVFPDKLDIALVGLGVINSRHHLLVGHDVDRRGLAPGLTELQQLQRDNPAYNDCIAEICHRLFYVPVNDTDSTRCDRLVNSMDDLVIAAPRELIRSAGEIILIAGGAQKIKALRALVQARCPSAPINMQSSDEANLTLITDDRTARAVLADIE